MPDAKLDSDGFRMRLLRRHVPAARVAEAGDIRLGSDPTRQPDLINVPAGWWIVRMDGELQAVPPEVYERDFTTARKAERCCTVCGCTQDDACEGSCSWASTPDGDADDLCSACAEAILEAAGVTAAVESMKALRTAAAKAGFTLR